MALPCLPRLRRDCLFVFFALLAASASSLSAPPYSGRRVQDVLEEIRAQDLTIIYNTAMIPAELLVKEEPKSNSPLSLALEVLAQHRLELMRVAPRTYAVVRGTARGQTASESRPPPVESEIVEEVIVSTSRYALASENVEPSTMISQQEIDVLPRLGDETLRAVQRLPGAAGNGLSGLAAIRGGEPNETLIVLDGMQLFEPFHLKNFFSPVSLLDSRTVSAMEVYSGGFAAQYGTRLSAVVDARSIRPTEARYYELGANLFHTNALAAHRFAGDDGQWLLSARRSNLEEVISVLESDFGEPQYFDAFSKIHYDLSPQTRISVNYLGSRDTIEARQPSRAESTEAEYRNNYAWAALEQQWSPVAATRLIASFTDVTNERSGQVEQVGQIVGAVNDERFFHVAGLQLDGSYRAGRLLHTWGVSARRLSASYEYDSDVQFEADYPFPGGAASELTRSVRASPDGDEHAAYWSARMQWTRQFATETGLRWDDESYTGVDSATQLAPRLSAMYLLNTGQRVRLSWGRFFQSQAIYEAQVENELEFFSPAQRADQLVLSIESELRIGAELRVELYRKDYSQLRPHWENLFDPLVLVPELKADRVLVDPDRARAEGIEILISRRTGAPWVWWFGYTWSQVKDVIDGREFSRSWDQRHAITAGLHWSDGRWDITLADTYHTGWPTTPVRLAANGGAVEVGARNSVRFDDFNSLDLRVSRRFPLARGELDAFLEVSNLANERNPCCLDVSAMQTEQGSFVLNRSARHWLGIVPSLGVLWRY